MAKLAGIKKFIDFLLETYPQLGVESIYAEHDVLHLPYPNGVSIEFLEDKARECGINVSISFEHDGSIDVFV